MLQTLRSPGGLPPNAAPTTAGYNVLSFPLGEVVDFVIWNQDTGAKRRERERERERKQESGGSFLT